MNVVQLIVIYYNGSAKIIRRAHVYRDNRMIVIMMWRICTYTIDLEFGFYIAIMYYILEDVAVNNDGPSIINNV